MDNFPSISIIIPSWNQGQYIERTLLSILRQDYPGKIEVIVSDGGSSDNTVEVLHKYNSQITWWSASDKGYVDAVTKGLHKATGELIGIQSSDDYYLPGAFRRIASAFQEYPTASFISGGEYGINLEDEVVYKGNPSGQITPYTILFTTTPPQHATFVKRECIEQVGGMRREVDMCADMDLWYRISHLVPGQYITDFLAVYQYHPNQRTKVSTKWYNSLTKMVESCEQDPLYSKQFRLSSYDRKRLFAFWKLFWPNEQGAVSAKLSVLKMLPQYFQYDARTKTLLYNYTILSLRNKVLAKLKSLAKPKQSLVAEPVQEAQANLAVKIDNSWLYN